MRAPDGGAERERGGGHRQVEKRVKELLWKKESKRTRGGDDEQDELEEKAASTFVSKQGLEGFS